MTSLILHHVGIDAAGRRRRRMRPLAAMLCLRRHHALRPAMVCVCGLQATRLWRNKLQREQHDWAMFQLRQDRQSFLAVLAAEQQRCKPWRPRAPTTRAGDP